MYHLGRWGGTPAIPPVADHCVSVDAGPLRFVVEARQLTDEVIAQLTGAPFKEEGFDDFGPSLHVFGRADGLEYLRFDCFEKDPHYHYFFQAEDKNLVCRLDDVADGDPVDWTLGRLRGRLPEMLAYVGASELASATREASSAVTGAVEEVAELFRKARTLAQIERAAR